MQLGGDQCKSVIWCAIGAPSLVGLESSLRRAARSILLHGSMAGQAGAFFLCWK